MPSGCAASDPRVAAAIDWLNAHPQVDAVPGFPSDEVSTAASQGLFYYYAAALARAMSAYPDAQFAARAPELAAELVSRQRPDGSWANTIPTMREDDPLTATCLALEALDNLNDLTNRAVLPSVSKNPELKHCPLQPHLPSAPPHGDRHGVAARAHAHAVALLNPPGGVTAEQVNEAIADGVRYLKSEQRDDGTWEERPLYAGGLTPLATLALLQSGCGVQDEAVAKALKHLRQFHADATYTTALQTMVFCYAEPERDLILIQRNVRWLEEHQIRDGENAGMWAIPTLGTPDHTDNSMTHMAMLALYEAERVGVTAVRRNVAPGPRLLATFAESRRLVGLGPRLSRHGQHDGRRHRLRPRRFPTTRTGRRPRRWRGDRLLPAASAEQAR